MKAKVGMVRRNMIHFDEDRIVLTAVRDNGQKTLTFDREQINIEWLSDEQAVVSIKKFLKSKKLTHKLWLPVVPLGNILFKTIEIPSINTAEVGQMIRWRLQTSWDVEKNLVWDYKVVLKEGGRSKVLVVGVDKMNLARYWRILKNSGMRFEVFSASCFLVEGLIQSKYGPLAKDYAVIWADDHDYELCVFKGADLIGTKLFGRDNEDRFLLDQIGLYLRICESERQISLSEMFVAAPQKDLDALNAFFKNGLGLPVRPIDIESLTTIANDSWMFSWVPFDVQEIRDKGNRIRIWLTFVLLIAVLAGSVVAFFGIRYVKETSYLSQLRREESNLQTQVDHLLKLQHQVEMISLKNDQRSSMSQWFEKLDTMRPSSVYLNKLEWHAGTGLVLQGFSAQEADINEWQKHLAASRLFKDVILQSVSHQGQGNDGLVSFKIRCVYDGMKER